MMAGIRSSDTRPEIVTRKALHKLGYRFRLDSRIGKIKPDIVLTRRKVTVFLHGCYFHQHEGCKLAYSDRNYSKKWRDKFEANRQRDQRVNATLLEKGWRVAVIWECVTRDENVFRKTMTMLDSFIKEEQGTFFESDYRKT
jgi:DNA mismatch endonuclease Vsr